MRMVGTVEVLTSLWRRRLWVWLNWHGCDSISSAYTQTVMMSILIDSFDLVVMMLMMVIFVVTGSSTLRTLARPLTFTCALTLLKPSTGSPRSELIILVRAVSSDCLVHNDDDDYFSLMIWSLGFGVVCGEDGKKFKTRYDGIWFVYAHLMSLQQHPLNFLMFSFSGQVKLFASSTCWMRPKIECSCRCKSARPKAKLHWRCLIMLVIVSPAWWAWHVLVR